MPKYCLRNDGAVYPYSTHLAKLGNFKVVDELPTNHLNSIEAAKVRVDTRIDAAKRMRAQQDERDAARKAVAVATRKRIAEKPAVDQAQSEESQRQADEFAGKGSEPKGKESEFVIATADKEALIAFAKDNFDATLAKNMKVENMRKKVAELAGVNTDD